jgi:tetratricopeptide (TPR) repeat protein/mono/diheme cytochrome c family protein
MMNVSCFVLRSAFSVLSFGVRRSAFDVPRVATNVARRTTHVAREHGERSTQNGERQGLVRGVAAAMMWALLLAHPCAGQEVTFNRDIAPIVFERCAGCHRPGAVGPFSLTSYQDVRQRASQVALVTERRLMPPWKAEDPPGLFADERRLTDAEIARIGAWVSQGAVEGNPADLPPLPRWTDGWQLGTPDLVVEMPAPYMLAADGPDVFRTFVLPVPLASDRYVRGIEFRPGNARPVHHANIGIDRTRASRRQDLADAEPGFSGGMTSTSAYPAGQMLGWTPGQRARPSPPDAAWLLASGSDLVAQLHLQPTGKVEPVQISVAFYFTDARPAREPVGIRLGSETIDIAPGSRTYTITDSYRLPVDVDVLAVQPHAHNLARRIEGWAVLPDGTTRPLVTIADWDFRWQDVYRYAAPFALPAGTTLVMQAVYDNSADNARNPYQPPRRIVWGQNTNDEMGDLWVQVVAHAPSDWARLSDDVERKKWQQDLAGYLAVLSRNPGDAGTHEIVAALYLREGRTVDAMRHLRESLRIAPGSAPALFSLGVALSMERRFGEAIAAYVEALEADPAYADAHANLGATLHLSGRFDEAVAHYRRALQLAPENADVHSNLARVLGIQGQYAESAAHFREALRQRPDSVSALLGLAWTLATAPDPAVRDAEAAIRAGERAAQMTGRRDPVALDSLGAAYAAAGRFAEAEAEARAARDLAVAAGAALLADEIGARLARYQQGLPFTLAVVP